MPQYVAILREKTGPVAVWADVQRQESGLFTILLRSCAEEDGSPEGFHPERLTQSQRDEAGRQVREQAATDGIAGPWS